MLFPHLSQFREMSRIAIYQAMTLEKEGKYEEGLRIRHSLMRTCGLMRVYGQTLICDLVANAMASLAASRPEGAPIVKTDATLSREKRKELSIKPYVTYLRKIGHGDEGEWVKREFAEELRLHDITSSGMQRWDVIRDLMIVLIWRLAGLLLLSMPLLTLVLVAASTVLPPPP